MGFNLNVKTTAYENTLIAMWFPVSGIGFFDNHKKQSFVNNLKNK